MTHFKKIQSKLQTLNIRQKLIIMFCLGLLEGFMLLSVYRFATFEFNNPHHHANFEIWVEGQKVDFEGFRFFESVVSCSAETQTDPKERVHMHEDIDDLVHVHADLVTWDNFFSNIDVSVSDSHVQVENEVITETEDKKVSFILNGIQQRTLRNTLIQPNDKLLINISNEPLPLIMERAAAISDSSIQADQEQDPYSCGGGQMPTIGDRFKGIFN